MFLMFIFDIRKHQNVIYFNHNLLHDNLSLGFTFIKFFNKFDKSSEYILFILE